MKLISKTISVLKCIGSTAALFFIMETAVQTSYWLLCLAIPYQDCMLFVLRVMVYTLLVLTFGEGLGFDDKDKKSVLHLPKPVKNYYYAFLQEDNDKVAKMEERHKWHMREHQVEIAFTRMRCEEILQICFDMRTMMRSSSFLSLNSTVEGDLTPTGEATSLSAEYVHTEKKSELAAPFEGGNFQRLRKKKRWQSCNSFFRRYGGDAVF